MAHFMCIISSTKTGTHQQTTKENKIHTTKSLFNGIQTKHTKKTKNSSRHHITLHASGHSLQRNRDREREKKENNFKCGRGIHDLIKNSHIQSNGN